MSKYAIEVDGISKEYFGRKVLNNISFNVSRDCIHGFLGPNGAGKSTTISIICGLLSADSGNVNVHGESIFESTLFKEIIGVLPENPPLHLDMTVYGYLKFVLGLYKMKNKEERIEKVLYQVGLTSVARRLIGNLSKGYKQKVGIAQALITDPQILILDEPTVGLDPHAVIEIRDLIKKLKRDHTIMLSSHQLHEVGKICDEITIINDGKILESGSMESIMGSLDRSNYIEIVTDQLDESCFNALLEEGIIASYEKFNESYIRVFPEPGKDSDIISRRIFENGMSVKHFENKVMDLEELFVYKTKGEPIEEIGEVPTVSPIDATEGEEIDETINN